MLLFSIIFPVGPEIPAARIDRVGIGNAENIKYCLFLRLNIESFLGIEYINPALHLSTFALFLNTVLVSHASCGY